MTFREPTEAPKLPVRTEFDMRVKSWRFKAHLIWRIITGRFLHVTLCINTDLSWAYWIDCRKGWGFGVDDGKWTYFWKNPEGLP